MILLTVLKKKIVKAFAICSHGGHLCHVNLTFYIKFHSPYLTMLHIRFDFNRPSGFREETRGRGKQLPGVNLFFININLLSICILSASPPPLLIAFYVFSPFKCISDLC